MKQNRRNLPFTRNREISLAFEAAFFLLLLVYSLPCENSFGDSRSHFVGIVAESIKRASAQQKQETDFRDLFKRLNAKNAAAVTELNKIVTTHSGREGMLDALVDLQPGDATRKQVEDVLKKTVPESITGGEFGESLIGALRRCDATQVAKKTLDTILKNVQPDQANLKQLISEAAEKQKVAEKAYSSYQGAANGKEEEQLRPAFLEANKALIGTISKMEATYGAAAKKAGLHFEASTRSVFSSPSQFAGRAPGIVRAEDKKGELNFFANSQGSFAIAAPNCRVNLANITKSIQVGKHKFVTSTADGRPAILEENLVLSGQIGQPHYSFTSTMGLPSYFSTFRERRNSLKTAIWPTEGTLRGLGYLFRPDGRWDSAEVMNLDLPYSARQELSDEIESTVFGTRFEQLTSIPAAR